MDTGLRPVHGGAPATGATRAGVSSVLPVTPVCDPGRVPVLNSAACPSLTAVAPLRLGRVRTVVALATHSGEELCAAGGLLASLAAAGARVRVLVVTDEISDPDRAPVPVGQRRVRLASAYQLLGLDPASRYRLGLHRVTGAAGEADVLGAISELLGFADPKGLLCVAPWIHDTHPDHDAVGRAATAAAHAYHARLLYYSITAWGHPGIPARSDVPVLPLRQARRFALPQALDTRKYQALAHLGRPPLGAPASTPTPPAPGAQACEVFIT